MARQMLAGAYGAGSLALAQHLAHLMGLAATDLALVDPTRLYRRFLKWILTRTNAAWPVASGGHAVIPACRPGWCAAPAAPKSGLDCTDPAFRS